MEIARNAPCPCGSGKKYKKCCLNEGAVSQPIGSTDFLRNLSSDFSYIEPIAKKIRVVIEKYDFRDAVMAIFCLNLWRRNRSALAQGLSLNMALSICRFRGAQPIQSYSELKSFYNDISGFIRTTPAEDRVIDDFGEVFINHAGKSYPVIIGTGHQQVYSALRYMQMLASACNYENELITILSYINTIISFTKETNIPNTDCIITHELPSEEFWDSIKCLLASPLFQAQVIDISQIMGYQFGPIELRHFIMKDSNIFPLCNSSILLDYYKLILASATEEEKDSHIINTIHSLVENSFNFSPNTPSRVLINPMVIDCNSGEKVVSDGLIFAGFGSKGLLIAIKSSNNQVQTIIKTIDELKKLERLRLVEPYYRAEVHGAYGVDIKQDYDICYMLVDPFTDITSHAFWLEESAQEFKCTALDALNLLGFANGIDELIDFIHWDHANKTQIVSFGGKNNLFFAWKRANRLISSGAIEFGHMVIDYNQTEEYTYSHFADMLCEFPQNDNGLFSDPLNWNVEDAGLGYKSIYHRGCPGFGGEIKRLGSDVHVFLGHNVEFFTESDFAQDAHTAQKTIDELNQRLFVRYADLISNIDILKGKTLQLLFMPWQYAKKRYARGFMLDSSRHIVFSDEHLEQDSLIIRYSVNPEVVLTEIQNSTNRQAENTYFKELLQPLGKYSPDKFMLLEAKLNDDSSLKKTVGVFNIEQHYYFSDRALDTKPSAASFAKARKEIAKVCMESEAKPGEYHGEAAKNTIRDMQHSAVQVFEKYISDFDKLDLHKQALNYYAVQQNGVILNLKRYFAFSDLDEDIQQEVEQNTREIREKYRRNTATAMYLLESNLVVTHLQEVRKCSKEDFEFLIAFADWLVVLQNAADTCHHTDFDLAISVDFEYKVNTILNETSHAQADNLLLRKYSTRDYHAKGDEADTEFLKRAVDAFKRDTGIELSLLISLIEYMQLDIVQSRIATEIYPNVFEIEQSILEQKFSENLEGQIIEPSIIAALVNFLTLTPSLLKTENGTQHDFLPIWKREQRDNRFDTKPIVMFDGKCIFSPVVMNSVLTSWQNGIPEWYLPYEIGLPTLTSVLRQWKKRYEDEMVQDIAQLFRDTGFDLVIPEVDLARRFRKDAYPAELGDYDIIAINKDKREIWIVESKVLQKVGSIYKDQMQQESFFCQHKDDEKFQKRIDFMLQNTPKVLASFGVEPSDYKVIPYMVTNKVFASRYKKIAFPIIAYGEMRQILIENLVLK